MPRKWKKFSSKYVYQNPWIRVREDEVIRPDGEKGIYGVVEPAHGISVVAVEDGGKIWMVKHYRYVFDDVRWELADGDIEAGESPLQAAQRELLEELGLRAASWKRLGEFRPSDGLLDQKVDVFLASSLKPSRSPVKEYDIADRKAFTLGEINEMIKGGEIRCGYATSALYLYNLHLLNK